MKHADDAGKRLSIKFQVYMHAFLEATEGEDFDDSDMQDIIDYVNLIAKKKKRARENK